MLKFRFDRRIIAYNEDSNKAKTVFVFSYCEAHLMQNV